jgi:hypothetical protein
MAAMTDLADHAQALADAIEEAIPGWVDRCVEHLYHAWTGQPVPPELRVAAAEAGRAAVADVGRSVRTLLEADIDQQATTPLALLRGAVRYPTAVLEQAGVAPVERDPLDEQMFPSDIYGLAPATLADLDPSLLDLGLAWGAAKAWTHKRRHGGASS